MPLIDVFGMWKKHSKGGNDYLSSGKMKLRDLKAKFHKAFGDLGPDDEVYLNIFFNENKRSDKAPDASLSLSSKDKEQDTNKGDMNW